MSDGNTILSVAKAMQLLQELNAEHDTVTGGKA